MPVIVPFLFNNKMRHLLNKINMPLDQVGESVSLFNLAVITLYWASFPPNVSLSAFVKIAGCIQPSSESECGWFNQSVCRYTSYLRRWQN